jgi:hypothetical protein
VAAGDSSPETPPKISEKKNTKNTKISRSAEPNVVQPEKVRAKMVHASCSQSENPASGERRSAKCS